MRLTAAIIAFTLAASPAFAEGESCEGPAMQVDGPVCRHSENPRDHLIRVLKPLWEASGFADPIYVFFLNSIFEPNAVAMPASVPQNKDGVAKIGVTVGMWDIVQNDDELAFVLAHELSHLAAVDVEYVQGLVTPLLQRWEKTKDYKRLNDKLMATRTSAPMRPPKSSPSASRVST